MKTRIITAAVGLGVLAVVLAFFDTFLSVSYTHLTLPTIA